MRAKAPVSHELRLPLQRSGDPVPDEPVRLVRAYTRGMALRLVALLPPARTGHRLTRDSSAGEALFAYLETQAATLAGHRRKSVEPAPARCAC